MEINKNISIKGDFWGLFLGIVLCVFFAACDNTEKRTVVAPDLEPSFTSEIDDQSYIQGRTITPLQLPQASDGNAPLTYSLSLEPAGIEFDISTQMLTGTPSASLSSTELTYTVQDADGDTDTITFFVEVVANLTPSFTREITNQVYIQGITRGSAILPEAMGGDGELTYSLEPWPDGMTFDSGTRELSGFPTNLGSSTSVTYTATDVDDDAAELMFNVIYRTPQTINICGRTQQVQEAIIALISGAPACNAVTELQLAGITVLRLDGKFIISLQANDFEGLSNLRDLQLWGNRLTTFPEDVFDVLTSLQILDLSDNFLETLPEDLFYGLTSLQTLDLSRNSLTALPENVFEGLSNLAELDLSYNDLTTLPSDVFNGLTSLTNLDLRDNVLDATPAICSAGVSCILVSDNTEGG